ncbi:MAG TPA: DUF1707 domain-containing protein [Pseudonocardiaceae bacterium]
MSEFQDADLRVADSEREAALTVLGEHMSAGRLNIDEYGERSAQVSTAKTRGELRALFSDLPPPHPQFGQFGTPGGMRFGSAGIPVPPPVVAPQSEPMAPRPGRPMRAIVAGMVPLAILVALGLDFATHLWVFFLIPVAVMAFGSSIWGRGWRDDYRGRGRRRY